MRIVVGPAANLRSFYI